MAEESVKYVYDGLNDTLNKGNILSAEVMSAISSINLPNLDKDTRTQILFALEKLG